MKGHSEFETIAKVLIMALILIVSVWFCYYIATEKSANPGDYIVKSAPLKEASLDYINKVRQQFQKGEIAFDERVYNLAAARLNDLIAYDYFDHTNPYTKTCADSMKKAFGLSSDEYVAENIFAYTNENKEDIAKTAVEAWLNSIGHRANLLYDHASGAMACNENMCVFLGLNHDGYGKGCYRA